MSAERWAVKISWGSEQMVETSSKNKGDHPAYALQMTNKGYSRVSYLLSISPSFMMELNF